jgi:hypothetical protein
MLLFFWTKPSKPPQVRILIVRRVIEQGKEMVFFRIIGPDDKRARISQIVPVSETSVPPSSMANVLETIKAEASGRVLASKLTAEPGRSFGERAPTGATVWKVRVTVRANVSTFRRLQLLPSAMLRMTRTAGSPLWKDIWITWDGFFDSWVFDSEPITNSVTSAGEVSK